MTDLHLATRGDRDALRRVIEPWWPKAVRWAVVWCGDHQLAQDAVQEALVRVIAHIETLDPSRPFGPWLKRIVHNACRDAQLQRGRRIERETPLSDRETGPQHDPGEHFDLRRGAAEARAAFARLSPRQREIVDRVDLQGSTPGEVAQELEITAGAVRAQLFAARKALRSHLSRSTDLLHLVREA